MTATSDVSNDGLPVRWLFLAIVAMIVVAVLGFRALKPMIVAGNAGSISLSQITMRWVENELVLSALADVDLPASMQAGLDNGVPLTFIMDVRLQRARRGWFDQQVARFQNRYTLTYYELTRHYRVQVVQSNASHNYRSLTSALAGLGRFSDVRFPLKQIEQSQFTDKTGLIGSVRFRLDTAALPLPLQPLIRSSWNLASEEYQWPVN